MKILKVIHGYPMRHNAGSEVYTQTLCKGLVNAGHEVQVFTRKESPFEADYAFSQELDKTDSRILLNIINLPRERNRYKYVNQQVDERFEKILEDFSPDILHIGHLNHLSLTIIDTIKKHQLPIVYTLHDYWLMCPRGQFIQRNSDQEIWALCPGQENSRCAKKCYSGYFSGLKENSETDIAFWTDWVEKRMQIVRKMVEKIDLFIAPSKFLMEKYIGEFNIKRDKIVYLDYGFDLTRISNRKKAADSYFTFGYIGTHVPAKGIQLLIKAFTHMKKNCKLKIWGKTRSENTGPLKEICSHLPEEVQNRVEWLPEYKNKNIVRDVFNHVDAIVVPSIWYENSPLVIHEAQQAGIPVITADSGGMSEYVHHKVNGLLFQHRNVASLIEQMSYLSGNPELTTILGKKCYLFSKTGDIPSIQSHVKKLEDIYTSLPSKKNEKNTLLKPGPWRITFDTNPDDCNLRCIMCEGFSEYSTVKNERVAQGIAKRRMDISLIRKVLEEAKGTPLKEIIPSTMGEPLVYKHFDKILEMCHEFNIKLNLTTNGTFPIRGAEEWAKVIVPVTSDVKISWNAATKETQEKIMIGTNWEKVLNNLKTFIRIRDEHASAGGNRCRVTLQLTFLQLNVHELPDVVRLGIKLGVDRIKGHHLWAHFKEIKDLSMRRNKESIVEWNKAVKVAQEVANNFFLPNGKRIILENIYPLKETANKELMKDAVCPFLGKEAWINTEGKFSPCCAPDKERIKLGEFGNVQNTTLSKIWKSTEYQELRRSYLKYPLCIGCNMRKPLLHETA